MVKTKEIIYNMILEAMGVPEKIIDTAEEIYNQILKKISSLSLKDFEKDKSKKVKISGKFVISDFVFKKIKLDVNISTEYDVDRVILSSMAVEFRGELSDDATKLIHTEHENGVIKMRMDFATPENWTVGELVSLLEKDRSEVISNLSHELMHVYDNIKTPHESPKKRAAYNSYSGGKSGVWPLDVFLHDLYFIHSIENTVRPSEVFSYIKTDKITRKEFLNFLYNNKTYITLKRISNFSLDGLKQKLKNHIEDIDKVFDLLKIDKPNTDEEKIDEMLHLFFNSLSNTKIESYEKVLSTNFFELLMKHFPEYKQDLINSFISSVTRFKSYEEFFEYEQKYFRYYGTKMIKKIAKLYDLTSP